MDWPKKVHYLPKSIYPEDHPWRRASSGYLAVATVVAFLGVLAAGGSLLYLVFT